MPTRLLPVVLVLTLAALWSAPTPASKLADAGYPSVLVPSARVQLSPTTDGVVAELLVERGESVVAGQLLARLESDVEAAELALAEARAREDRGVDRALVRVEELERKVERLTPLAEQGIASAESFDQAQVELATARLDLRQAEMDAVLNGLEADRSRARLAQRELRSPVDGVVIDRRIDVGELASRSGEAVVLEIASVDPLHADVRVPLELFDDIAAGSEATVRLDLDGGMEVPATVLNVDRVADAASGTIRVRIRVDNAAGAIPAGAPARVLFHDLR